MSKQEALEGQVEAQLSKLGYDLVETKKFQNGQHVTLRVTISDPVKHVGHDQCAQVSKALRSLLDEQDLNWNLEVWSPGIGRELKSQRDFKIFTGKLVEIIFDGNLTEIGELKSRDEQEVKIMIEGQEKAFPSDSISKVILAHDTRPAQTGSDEVIEISVEDI